MNENQILKESIKKLREEAIEENANELTKNLSVSKTIIDRDYQLDNSPTNFDVIEQGERVNIVKKDNIYYLQNANDPNADLYHPSEDLDSQYDLWVQSNHD